ncbi:MAG: MarR family transcriptional regulator [Saprospiraceae bacterium]|nr:MarR family transcriptional regulator [Saprospiraceae bacterium]
MKLEAELKSTKPLQPRQRAFLNILFTASWLDCFITRQLRPYGLTGPQYNILRILNGSSPKGLSVLDIKSRMLDRSSNVSRLVEKLRIAGLVERVPHTQDRRMVIVTISESGKKTLTDIEQSGFNTGQNSPGNKLTETDAMDLAHLLDKFRE